ncbi:hypothetical protein EJB05_05106, partial [Eragrostis curvula]
MAAEASRAVDDARMKITCSHGGRLAPCGPNGALRYVGGETRVLVVPRAETFCDLAARLSEMAGGAEVRAIRHRLADEGLEDVIVSVTCDDELAYMRDEYDRLRATRPASRFRVFVTTTSSASASSGGSGAHQRRPASGLPPLAPKMRRVQSEQALVARAQLQRRRPAYPVPIRRVQSAQELASGRRLLPSFYHQQYRRDVCAPVAPTPAARPTTSLPQRATCPRRQRRAVWKPSTRSYSLRGEDDRSTSLHP